jgi:phage tail-like protein
MSMTIEQLLATLAIDEAQATVVAGRIVIIQRDPQPGETGIDVDTDIKFLIVDLDADPLATLPLPSFTIYVEGAQVGIYGGGIYSPIAPWTGSVSATTASDPFVGWYVTIQQPAPPLFASEQVVDVKVDTNLAAGYGHSPYGHFPWGHPSPGTGSSFEYSFTIEDITPPALLSAEALDLFTARLTFDDEMATSGAGSVLDLSKWAGAITRLNEDPKPGVNLEVVGVEEVEDSNGTQFDLTFQWEMTQLCLYEVLVDPTVEDSSGNAMDPDGSTAQFFGYKIPDVERRNFGHWHVMVPLKNRQEDQTRDLERFSNCIDEVLRLLLESVDRFTDQFDPDKATDEQIDAMLYDMGNPFEWAELVLTPNERRKLLRVLIRIYKLKGTDPGIEGTVRFLLGENVEVVEYAAEGWVLGEDELGEGSIAEVLCDAGETYDLSVSKTLKLETDGYVDSGGVAIEQEIVFNPGDFVVPSAALASEVVAVINAQIQSGGAYVVAAGTPAEYTVPGSPFNLSGGEDVQMEINGVSHTVVFHVDDFETPTAATADEVAARFHLELSEDVYVAVDGAEFSLTTIHTGADAHIKFTGGTALAALGLSPGDEIYGTDAKRVSCYSDTAGVDSWIQITGGTANDVLDFDTDTYGGTGGAILAPTESYTLYSFDIETETELDSETVAIIRRIAEYMKPAHTHLINIRPAPPLPWPDGWVLGVDELDVSAELAE